LTLILGPVQQLLSEAGGLGRAAWRDMQVVERNAQTLLKHVDDLLDIAKLDEGKLAPRYTALDLAALVRRVAGNFEALPPRRRIDSAVDAPATLAAELDPAQVERVLLNLLSNAFKFTPDGGTVRCHLGAADARATLVVEDSGPGIRPEQREAIFERFR